MTNSLASQDQITIANFMRNCHRNGEFKIGRISGDRFLKDNNLNWRETGSEFLTHYSICCYLCGDLPRSFEIGSYLLDYRPLSDSDRKRIEFNCRDGIEQIKDTFIAYPSEIVQQILKRPASPSPKITFSITTSNRMDLFTRTMNSFLQCCQDISLIDEWLCIDENSSLADRAKMQELYPFFNFIWKDESQAGRANSMNLILQKVKTPYLFQCEDDWQFFRLKPFLTESVNILEANEKIGQVLINRNYAQAPNDYQIIGGYRKNTAQGIYYTEHEYYPPVNHFVQEFAIQSPDLHSFYWPHFSLRPSLARMDALIKTGEFNQDVPHFELDYAYRYTAEGYHSAFFNSIYCLRIGQPTLQRDSNETGKGQQKQLSVAPLTGRKIRIKPLAWWCNSRRLCELLNKQSKGDYQWNNLELTSEDDADFFAIFQAPYANEYYVPERTVFFQAEALAEEHPERWGEQWSNPDPRHFLQVRKFLDFPNCPDWHIGLSYIELIEDKIIEKTKLFSVIVSARYTLEGHIKRLDFLKYYEEHSNMPKVDIYGYDNSHEFRNYCGSLPERDKSQGLIPYRYTFNAENQAIPNYFTEKIIDAILAETLCFYWGCPNLEEFIDPRTFIRLDLDDLEGSMRIISTAIENNEWLKRLPFIREQKKRILESMHFLPVMERILREASTPVYAINLERRPDRWSQIQKNLKPHWENFTRYSAQDGQKLKLTQTQKEIFKDNQFGNRKAVIACALSHIDLWNQLSEDASHNHYLILEDDVEFCEGFGDRLRETLDIVKNHSWDLVFLGAHIRREHKLPRLYDRKAGIVHLSFQPPEHMIGGAFAYLISQNGVRKLLNLIKTKGIQYPIDTFMMLNFERLQIYFTEPHLVFSEYVFRDGVWDQVDSDIQHDFSTIE